MTDLRVSGEERGFTLIEILVVLLIIGALVGIAIPLFLSQTSKATDASAKEMARAAAETAEAYALDHNGSYGGLEPKALHEIEPAVQIAEGNNDAYVTRAEATGSGKGFVVTATSPNGDTFTFRRLESGDVERSCEVKTGSSSGGCPSGTW
jgi:prepilin-type N-terminal cleavage/methylation domain-containing protein